MDASFHYGYFEDSLSVHEELVSGTRTYSDWEAYGPTTKYKLKLPHRPVRQSDIWSGLAHKLDPEPRERELKNRLRWLHTLDLQYWSDDSDTDDSYDADEDNSVSGRTTFPPLKRASQKASRGRAGSDTDDVSNPERIASDNGKYIFGIPKAVLEEHGELSAHVILRAWDLNLALEAIPLIPNVENTDLAGDTFSRTLQASVLRVFYVNLFQRQLVRALSNWERDDERYERCHTPDTPFETDMLARNHEDLMMRLKGEAFMLRAMRDGLHAKPFRGTLSHTQMGNERWADEDCEDCVRQHYVLGDQEFTAEVKAAKTKMLKDTAMRMVGAWDTFMEDNLPRLSVQDVVARICRVMLKLREDAMRHL